MLSGGGGITAEQSRTLQMDEHEISRLGGSANRETGVGSKLRNTHHMVNKQDHRSDNFRKVRDNALCNAIDAHSRHLMRDHRDKQRAKKFREFQDEVKAHKVLAFTKLDEKHTYAVERFNGFNKSYTAKGLEAAKKHIVDVDANTEINVEKTR